MAFWPFWQPSSNKLAILLFDVLFYLCCFWKINSSSAPHCPQQISKALFSYKTVLQCLQSVATDLSVQCTKIIEIGSSVPKIISLHIHSFIHSLFAHKTHTKIKYRQRKGGQDRKAASTALITALNTNQTVISRQSTDRQATRAGAAFFTHNVDR